MKTLAFVMFGFAVVFAKCPPDQELGIAEHGFVGTCAVPKKPNGWYYKFPNITRCLCKKGYTFETSEQKKCIPLKDCGKGCPPNQEPGVSDHEFIETCSVPKKPIWWNDEPPSTRRCLCKKGYTFETSELKKCIPSKDCGKDCPPHTEYVMTSTGFRPTCAIPKRPKHWIGLTIEHKACLCKKGYVLKSWKDERCIPLKNCPKPRT